MKCADANFSDLLHLDDLNGADLHRFEVFFQFVIANDDRVETALFLRTDERAFTVLLAHSPTLQGNFNTIVAANAFITLLRNADHAGSIR
jgi:hypothetical protein